MIVPTNQDLSLEEIGLLSTMLNDIDADYTTLEYLVNNSADEKENVKKILDSLVEKKYLFLKNEKFIVNKEIIPLMLMSRR